MPAAPIKRQALFQTRLMSAAPACVEHAPLLQPLRTLRAAEGSVVSMDVRLKLGGSRCATARWRWWVWVLVLLVAGCASVPPAPRFEWTRRGLDAMFPAGTTKRQVYLALGEPTRSVQEGDGLRWEYTGMAGVRAGVIVFRSLPESRRSVIFTFDGDERLIRRAYTGM